MKEKFQALLYKINEKAPKRLRQPMMWCILAAALVCSLAVTVTIFGHDRGGTDRYYGLADGSSCVMEGEVAALYAENDAGRKLQANQSPQIAIVDPTVRSGAQTSQSDVIAQTNGTQAPASTQLPTPSAGAAVSAGAAEDDDAIWNDSIQYLSSAHETLAGSTGRAQTSPTQPPQYFTLEPDEPQNATATPGTPPVINYTLYEGAVSQQVVTFSVTAIDNTGNALTDGSVTLLCNNKTYTPVYTKDNVMTYALQLTAGNNSIKITAKDASGASAEAAETIVYTPQQQETIIVSVEATTVGFGYLVPPTAVTLEGDKPISYYVANVLSQYGYSISYTGDIETDFYLQSVGKTNAFANPSIPADLKAKILADSDASFAASLNESNCSPDALSQSNFTRDSGWMYCVNDAYYNVGMSYLAPVANDVIRVRYTLALGRDIGGGMQNTNWEKQW